MEGPHVEGGVYLIYFQSRLRVLREGRTFELMPKK